MIRKYIALFVCCCGLTVLVPSATAQESGGPTQRIIPLKTTYVYLNFDGNPNFPSITVQHFTLGLMPFTGSAFRLTPTERDLVKFKFVELLREDFQSFNIEFITEVDGVDSYYVWGIDDSSYIFEEGGAYHRLYGRTGGNPGKLASNMALYDDNHNPIWHPKFGRTFAGSFTLIPGNQVVSDPPLIPAHHCSTNEIIAWNCGNLLQAGAGGRVDITLDHIAQALANNAAQEIAQFFGADDTIDGTIMHAQIERTEAGTNKVFDNANQTLLLKSIGPAAELLNNGDGTVTDTRTGIMWTRDANIAAYWPSVCMGPIYGGDPGWNRMDRSSALSYANCLDLAGYQDWRLPSALNHNGSGPCGDNGRIGCELPYRYGCFASDLGDLYYNALGNERGNSSCYSPVLNADPFINIQIDPYWTEDRFSAEFHWIFKFQTGEQYPYHSHFLHSVWPMRTLYRLIDNGDGTITDTSTGLMWARDANVFGGKLSWDDAKIQAAASQYAGYNDWRLPKMQAPDGTCSDTKLFSGAADRMRACSRSELGHLFERWGITPANPFIFSLPGQPYSELRFWTAKQWAADPIDKAWVVYATLSGGITDVVDKDAPDGGYMWLVRPLNLGDTYTGDYVRVEPHTDVSLTFGHVSVKGLTNISVTAVNPFPDAAAPEFLGSFFDINTTSVYPENAQVSICLRYEHADVPDLSREAEIKIWQWQEAVDPADPALLPQWVDVTSRFYPDVRNNVICGSTHSLSWFALGMGEPVAPDRGLSIESIYFTPAAGVYEIFDPDDRMFAFWLEFRTVLQGWYAKPFVGLMATSENSFYGYVGAGFDIFFGDNVVLTPNFAVGAHESGDGKELGGPTIFRIGGELSYMFDNRTSVGLALHHLTNFGIDNQNPGAESLLLTYSWSLRAE